jgi:hypothetical protein
MIRFLTALAGSLLLAVALVVPVAASGGHASCAGFGAVTAALAPGGALGALVSSVAPTGPGVVRGIVASEHQQFCAAR